MQLSQVSSFIQALNTFRRQQLESRVLENSLYNYRLASGKRKVIKGLRYEWSNNRIVRFNTGLSVKTIQAKRVFKNLRLAKELVLQKETLQRQLEQHSEKILFKTALRGLLLAKEVSKAESTAIIKMCRIGERIVQEQCFDIIFASSQLHSEVALLTECAARIIKKMTFLRLVNRMLETKQKHSNFKQKQMLKQKAMLFQLLVQNSLRFRQSLEEARVLCLQYCKKRAIRDIIESNKFRNHKEKCLKRRKMLASNKFIQCCKLRLRCMTKFAVSKLAMKTVVQKMIIRQLIRDRKDRAQSIE